MVENVCIFRFHRCGLLEMRSGTVVVGERVVGVAKV